MDEQPGDRAGFGKIWLNRGIAAAKAGRRVEARDLLFRALNDESQREMAWLWLAAVSDDPRQEQAYLEKVLELNPDNRFAKAGLVTLEKRGLKDLPAAPVGFAAEDSVGRVVPQIPVERVPAQDAHGYAREVAEVRPILPEPAAPESVTGRSLAETEEDRPVAAPAQEEGCPEPEAGAADGLWSPDIREGQAGSTADELESFLEDEVGPSVTAEVPREPTGWTTQTPPVGPVRSAPQPEAQFVRSREGEYFASRSQPHIAEQPRVEPQVRYAEPRRVYVERQEVYGEPRPVYRQRVRRAPRREEHGPGGRAAEILSEAFDDHEMWTVLASFLSLILLGLLMAFFFTVALTLGK